MFKRPTSVSRLSLLAACGLGVVLSVSNGQAADFTRNNGYNKANSYNSNSTSNSNYNYNSNASSSNYGSGIGNTWQGAFIGIHAGLGIGKAGPNRISGAAGGLQGGYNWQSDRFVYGLEADYTASDLLSRSVADSYRQNWTVSGRGRAGYAFASNLLGYGTAGLAGSGTEYKSTNGKHNTTSYGWVAGLGAELMVDPRFTIRGELLHYEFGHETYPGSTGQVNLGNSTNVLRLGGNYKF
mgnify:CR=1 FL=1|jgi:outer membrane immunogenic protein